MKNWTNPSIAAVLAARGKYACVAGLGALIGILLFLTTGSAKIAVGVGIVFVVGAVVGSIGTIVQLRAVFRDGSMAPFAAIPAARAKYAKYQLMGGLGVFIAALLFHTTGSAKILLGVGIVPLVVLLWTSLGSWFSDALPGRAATDE